MRIENVDIHTSFFKYSWEYYKQIVMILFRYLWAVRWDGRGYKCIYRLGNLHWKFWSETFWGQNLFYGILQLLWLFCKIVFWQRTPFGQRLVNFEQNPISLISQNYLAFCNLHWLFGQRHVEVETHFMAFCNHFHSQHSAYNRYLQNVSMKVRKEIHWQSKWEFILMLNIESEITGLPIFGADNCANIR